jgi:hypothetical protein
MYLQKVLKVTDEIAGSGSASGSGFISQRYGFADPDPYQNFMDPQHRCQVLFLLPIFIKVILLLRLSVHCFNLNQNYLRLFMMSFEMKVP